MKNGKDIFDRVYLELSSREEEEIACDITRIVASMNAVQRGAFYRFLLLAAYPDEVEWTADELLVLLAAVKSLDKEQEFLLYKFASYARVMFMH